MSKSKNVSNAHEIRQKAPKTFGKMDRPGTSPSKTSQVP